MDSKHRPKPTGEGGRCGAISRFVFNWEAVANITHMALNKSIIRPYVQIIDRLIEAEQIIPVNISVSLRLFKNGSDDASASSDEFHFIQTVDVESKSDGWLELDITHAILSVWTPYSHQLPIIEITLRMEVDCVRHKKVPFQFANPAEVELSKTFRRGKFTNLQPLLLVFLEDRLVKDKLYTEKKLVEEEKEIARNGNYTIAVNETAARQKRSASTLCRKEYFTVNFTELHLEYIIAPPILNISKCAGSCSDYIIAPHPTIATNHARIMASAKSLNDNQGFKSPNSTMYGLNHKNPCCVPVEYEARYLTLYYVGSLHHQLFPEIVVKSCGCR